MIKYISYQRNEHGFLEPKFIPETVDNCDTVEKEVNYEEKDQRETIAANSASHYF